MNFNYCYYINKIIRDNKKDDPFIIILGDENQCINQYNGSDARFLTLEIIYSKMRKHGDH